MNLANLGRSGLLAAQNRLQTAGHNIVNAATPGYSRQAVVVQTAGVQATAAGWIGRGVQAVAVQRAYDAFLSGQLMQARSRMAALSTYAEEIGQINTLMADRTTGISPALQKFFDGVQAVASAPADVAARQELLGRAGSLVSQMHQIDQFFNEQRDSINEQIGTTIGQINGFLDRIQALNQKISQAQANVTGQEPNDLLDQQDELLAGLGELINVQIYRQGGQVSLSVGNGQLLLAGDSAFHLVATPDQADASTQTVSAEIPDQHGALMALALHEPAISGGRLGGLLAYRREVLSVAQNELGRLAVGLAQAINEQHALGFDLAGQPGAEFFSVGQPIAKPYAGNVDQSGPSVVIQDAAKLTGGHYQLQYKSGQYAVTRQPDGQAVTVESKDQTLSFEGLVIQLDDSAPSEGDRWLIEPIRGAVAGLQVQLTDPARFAAAGLNADGHPAGSAHGGNALQMAQLQLAKTLGGTDAHADREGSMSLNEAYSRLVNTIAVKTQTNTTSIQAQDALYRQSYTAQQSVSGVNLDEEFILLQRYQEQYRASARLIDTASTLFDTLLGLRP